jgi:hypothetical protein
MLDRYILHGLSSKLDGRLLASPVESALFLDIKPNASDLHDRGAVGYSIDGSGRWRRRSDLASSRLSLGCQRKCDRCRPKPPFAPACTLGPCLYRVT